LTDALTLVETFGVEAGVAGMLADPLLAVTLLDSAGLVEVPVVAAEVFEAGLVAADGFLGTAGFLAIDESGATVSAGLSGFLGTLQQPAQIVSPSANQSGIRDVEKVLRR
jgi:hypothetical protein